MLNETPAIKNVFNAKELHFQPVDMPIFMSSSFFLIIYTKRNNTGNNTPKQFSIRSKCNSCSQNVEIKLTRLSALNIIYETRMTISFRSSANQCFLDSFSCVFVTRSF